MYSQYKETAPSSNGVQGVSPDFIRLLVGRGFGENTIIGEGDVKGEFFSGGIDGEEYRAAGAESKPGCRKMLRMRIKIRRKLIPCRWARYQILRRQGLPPRQRGYMRRSGMSIILPNFFRWRGIGGMFRGGVTDLEKKEAVAAILSPQTGDNNSTTASEGTLGEVLSRVKNKEVVDVKKWRIKWLRRSCRGWLTRLPAAGASTRQRDSAHAESGKKNGKTGVLQVQ